MKYITKLLYKPLTAMSIATALMVGGCAIPQHFSSEVKVFSDLTQPLISPTTSGSPATPVSRDKSFRFAPLLDQAQSLEYKSYENAVRKVLLTKGFSENVNTSTYKIALTYSVSLDKTPAVAYLANPYNDGVFWRPNMNVGYLGSRWGLMGQFPLGWFHSRSHAVVTTPLFNRELKLDITDAATNVKRYEVTARNQSSQEILLTAIPYLAEAALDGFPQTTNSIKIVNIPIANQ